MTSGKSFAQRSAGFTTAEILFIAALVLIFAGVWARKPEIKLSSRTLESYDWHNPSAPAWHNGIGLTISAARIDSTPPEDAHLAGFHLSKGCYAAFLVTVDIQPAGYPTMVDLPYERMSLTDQSGKRFSLANERLAETTQDTNSLRALQTFDWSIVNNTFSRQGRVEKGVLVFTGNYESSSRLTLHLNVYHHPYKQIPLSFPFAVHPEPQGGC